MGGKTFEHARAPKETPRTGQVPARKPVPASRSAPWRGPAPAAERGSEALAEPRGSGERRHGEPPGGPPFEIGAGRSVQRRALGDVQVQCAPSAQGKGAQSKSPAGVESYLNKSRGNGLPLDSATRATMESGFGRDLGGVRVHTDHDAAASAESLGAQAYTSGRDIYFGAGRYQPGTAAGQHLLAHEVAHTVQQSSTPTAPQAKLIVGSSDDPAEHEADAAASRVVAGRRAGAPSASGGAGTLRRADNDRPDAAGGSAAPSGRVVAPADVPVVPGPAAGDGGGLTIKLGSGIEISGSDLTGPGAKVTVDLSAKPIAVPGLKVNKLEYTPARKAGKLYADLNIPFARAAEGGITLGVDSEGKTEFTGRAKLPLAIGVLNNPVLDLSVGADHEIAAELTISGADLSPRSIPKLKVEGGGEIRLEKGKVSGSVAAKLKYENLGEGDFAVSFKDGVAEGSGKVDITQEYLKGTSAALKVEQGNLTADVTIPATKIAPPIPGLEVPEGSIQLVMSNGDLSGSISGLKLVYRELGEATLNGSIAKGVAQGSGSFVIKIPAIDSAAGTIAYSRDGKLSGSVTIQASQFPKALPITGGKITAGIDEKGNPSFAGEVQLEFAGVGRGSLRGAYETGKLSLGADVALAIPGLQNITGRIDYVDGDLSGQIDVPIASDKLAGLSGQLHVEYREKLWKGEQTIAYNADNGKLSGSVKLGIMQKPEGALCIYGGGDVTAQLTSFLQGKLKLDILPEGTTKVYGAITVTEPIELFPEKKMDRELFKYSQNIPLWAILVAVIRFRTGIRAGIGPGQLRNITVEGEYTVGGTDTPSFTISGELFIPAYAEAYVAIGAGLGLDVLLGSLTGGIEAVGTAGIYGAVSVIPELSYQNGNYSIEGTATMAAAAKLKLSLQAWAEVEALWITVWENTWNLAEKTFDIGPTLALQANMKYVFGQSVAPELEFKTDDIDGESLIKQAMPKEGPGGSGAREALKNKAEWSGATKGKGKEADKVPEEVASKESKAGTPVAPPKPSKQGKPPPGTPPPAAAAGPGKEEGGKSTPELKAAVDKAAKDQAKDQAADKSKAVFPAPSPTEIEMNWANYMKDTADKGTRLPRPEFETRMRAGDVYHPKLNDFRKISADYDRAYEQMAAPDRDPATFAGKLRSGYIVSSPPEPDPQWDPNVKIPVPDADGTQPKPYSIHWPTAFLVSSFETFTVSGGRMMAPSGYKEQEFDVGGEKRNYGFGIAAEFENQMAIGSTLLRQGPERDGSLTAAAWRDWDAIGFSGATASAVGKDPYDAPSSVLPGGATMFAVHRNPYTEQTLEDLTFKQYLEQSAGPPGFTQYAHSSEPERDALRGKAREKKLDLRDEMGQVGPYLTWFRAAQAEKAKQQGHAGYEMQHVIPLFLNGAAGDKRQNMWPLAFAQHRQQGHSILKDQPQLKTLYSLPTDNLESPQLEGRYFQIVKHGSAV